MLLNHGPSPEESFSRARRPFSNSAPEATLGSQGQRLSVRLPQATAGVNWSPTDNLRAMLNYTYAAPNEVNTGVSSANFVGMRLGLFG